MAFIHILDEVYGLPGPASGAATPAPPELAAAVAVPARAARSGAAARARLRWHLGGLAALAWGGLAALTLLWPNHAVGFADWAYTQEFGWLAAAVGLLLALWVGGAMATGRAGWLRGAGPWWVALPLLLGLWQLLTAKLAWLPTPFFAPPQSLAEVYLDDWRRLGESTWHSARLLGQGVLIGALAGFGVGVAMGWSRQVGYWVHPVIRFVGPVPASALLPLAFFFFPSSHAAAVFLIALATGFPVAVLSWSGVAGVNRQYYDVARTLGASEWFLVLRVAIPAALPQVFVGLFMGLGASFSILVTAEMMGVKAGLGWYLSWAQGWAAYPNMYAALILMALLCSGLITLLFALRDRALSWQKGTLKW